MSIWTLDLEIHPIYSIHRGTMGQIMSAFGRILITVLYIIILSSLDKMATISQRIFSGEPKYCILIKISLKFVPRGPIDNNPALVKIIAWC